jgi:hypothetical protein
LAKQYGNFSDQCWQTGANCTTIENILDGNKATDSATSVGKLMLNPMANDNVLGGN